MKMLTHLAYRAHAKNVIYQTIMHSFESARKRALADVYCCKMTSVMALDFHGLKGVINT